MVLAHTHPMSGQQNPTDPRTQPSTPSECQKPGSASPVSSYYINNLETCRAACETASTSTTTTLPAKPVVKSLEEVPLGRPGLSRRGLLPEGGTSVAAGETASAS